MTTREFPIPDEKRARRARSRLESVPVKQISEHADRVRPGETFATVVTAVFFSIGWIIGATWRGVVFCCLAVRYGYRAGAHIPVTASKSAPVRGRPGPGGTLIEELRERRAFPFFPGLAFRAKPRRVRGLGDVPSVEAHGLPGCVLVAAPAFASSVLYRHGKRIVPPPLVTADRTRSRHPPEWAGYVRTYTGGGLNRVTG